MIALVSVGTPSVYIEEIWMSEANYDIRDRSGRARFSDIATLLRTPRREISSDIDIGLVGVPFDFSNGKAGTRHGPAAIREASRTSRRFHPTSGVNPFEVCRVADLGDAPVNPFDINKSITDIKDYFSELHKAGIRASVLRLPMRCKRRRFLKGSIEAGHGPSSKAVSSFR